VPLPISSHSEKVDPEIAGLLELARLADSVETSVAHADEAYARSESLDVRSRALAGRMLLYALYRAGQRGRVVEIAETVFSHLRHAALELECSETMRWAGLCAVDIGRLDDAIEWVTEAYEICDRLKDDTGRVLAYSLLGGAFDRLGDPWHGEVLLRKGAQFARELGTAYPLMVTLNNLCAVLIGKFYMLRDGVGAEEAQQTLVDAEPYAREVVALSQTLNDPFYDAFTLGNLGEILVHVGKLDEARSFLDRSRALAVDKGFHTVSSRVRCSYAELALALGDYEGSLTHVREARQDPATTNSPPTMLRIEYASYRVSSALGDFAGALQSLEALRLIESQRATQQLRARSQVMMTRLEASENERKGIERANAVASAHAARATELERVVFEDELTGLANRRAFDLKLPQILAAAASAGKAVSLAMIDVDHFKQANDRFGHGVGDAVLQQVAKILAQSGEPGDLIARIGGEEFVICTAGVSPLITLQRLEHLRLDVSSFAWHAMAVDLSVTVSVGVAHAIDAEPAVLLERADFAMYRAKRNGRNRVIEAS
jgi:diguanylate cyclase (GGDEF)-like protein